MMRSKALETEPQYLIEKTLKTQKSRSKTSKFEFTHLSMKERRKRKLIRAFIEIERWKSTQLTEQAPDSYIFETNQINLNFHHLKTLTKLMIQNFSLSKMWSTSPQIKCSNHPLLTLSCPKEWVNKRLKHTYRLKCLLMCLLLNLKKWEKDTEVSCQTQMFIINANFPFTSICLGRP